MKILNKEEVMAKLKELQVNDDIELAHIYADDLICDILVVLGYEDIVEEYDKIDKYFA